MMHRKKEWFGEWFDSPYYHILYKNHDEREAKAFLDELINYFHFSGEDHILDLACGKGRRSIYLAEQGYRVTGIDLAPHSIAEARKFETDRLHFFVHDMRNPFRENTFDYVLNLFTSFGYFDSKEEHINTILMVMQDLKPGGRFLLDYLNPYRVIHLLVPAEYKEVDGIVFRINKSYDRQNHLILKDISFEADGKKFAYQEKVKAITNSEFLNYFEFAGFKLIDTFGDYKLNTYNRESSERMIFVVEKPNI